jgi:hypothetical protein
MASAYLAIVAYVAAALVWPAVHRRHHALHGADHRHVGLGTIYLHDAAGGDSDVAHTHAQSDLDLGAIDLAEVAQAGTLVVDCNLQTFTLVDCAQPRPDHPHNFGDEMLARAPHSHAPPTDDVDHGAGSLEHLRLSFVASQPILLPPPARAAVRLFADRVAPPPVVLVPSTHAARAPPPSI